MSRRARPLIKLVALALAGCGDAPVGVTPAPAPVLEAATVARNAHNVLSAAVTVRVRHADSVAVRFRSMEHEGLTPAVMPREGAATVPMHGLHPDHRYAVQPVAYGAGGTVVGDALDLTTGSLPADLPRYSAGGADPSSGYVVFAAGKYGVVIDNTGRVVWYHAFSHGAGLSFMAQPTGRYVARPPTPAVGDVEPWVEIDPSGTVTRTLACARGLASRPHDLILESDGSYWVMCDETRPMDLTAHGGVANARVTGTVIQHVNADGTLRFEWNPFDHFVITDVDVAERRGASVNWTHGNALDFDTDGNLLVSFRNLGEITKVDVRTGAVVWRLGGNRNQFTFVDTPAPAFVRQHSVRATSPGVFVLLDNLGDPAESRAEHYVIDERTRTARRTRSYGSVPRVVTQIGGSVQPVPNGRTLVSFGTEGRVEEYDAEGRVVWAMAGHAGYVFRAQRIGTLYAPGVGVAR